MPSPYGGWRERGPCRPPTSHRLGQASPAAEGVGTDFSSTGWCFASVWLQDGAPTAPFSGPALPRGFVLPWGDVAWLGGVWGCCWARGLGQVTWRWDGQCRCVWLPPAPACLRKLKKKKRNIQTGKNEICPIFEKKISMFLLCRDGGPKRGPSLRGNRGEAIAAWDLPESTALGNGFKRGKGNQYNRLTRGSETAAASLHGCLRPKNPVTCQRSQGGRILSWMGGTRGFAGPRQGSAMSLLQVAFLLKETSSRCRLQPRAVPLPPHTIKSKQR